MLTREEVERRLEETDYDLGTPSSWPEMHMEASRCSCCGRWLQIVRPGKYQCECENEPEEKYREREALQTAQALYAERDELKQERNNLIELRDQWHRYWNDAIDKAYTLQAERDALAAEGRLLREALGTIREECVADGYPNVSYVPLIDEALSDAPLIAAEVERVKRLEAVAEAAEEYRDAEQVQMLNDFKHDEPKYERQRRAKKALDAAIAAYREREVRDMKPLAEPRTSDLQADFLDREEER